MLETYLGDGKGLDTRSHKFRDLRERFLESPPVVRKLILIDNHNPLRLVFRPANFKPVKADNKKRSEGPQGQNQKHVDPNSSEWANLIKEEYLPGPDKTIYYCTEHPHPPYPWYIDLAGMETSHFIPFHSQEVKE